MLLVATRWPFVASALACYKQFENITGVLVESGVDSFYYFTVGKAEYVETSAVLNKFPIE